MGGESPVVELYDSQGNPLSVQDGAVIPANTPGLLFMGSDGTNSRYILIDGSARQVMVGAGTAGTPTGGVITIQGIAGGTSVSISQTGNIDAGNSSTTPLASNGTFAGTGIDVTNYSTITVFVFTNKAGTLNLEFSTDNSNWDYVSSYAVAVSQAESVEIAPQAQYFRVVYQNGNQAQGSFRLQTIERHVASFGQTLQVSEQVDPNANALLTKSVITGRSSQGGGTYVDVKVTPSGALITDDAVASSTTLTTVAASASNVTLLSTNTSRLGATVWNDSTTATLYLSLGTGAASTSNFTAQLFPSGYYEVPYGYTGQINGIWSAAVGNARITELT